MKSLILIPARYASTRFPGKPLAIIGGKPMIQHVVEKAAAVSDDVFVATDDIRIQERVVSFGGKTVMTSSAHRSGTDRCFEAYQKVVDGGADYDVIVNIQGDEPFIEPQQIALLLSCFKNPEVQIATLAKQMENNDDVFDPNKVKVVFSSRNEALYFSRSPIPFCRGVEKENWCETTAFYKHIGMYAYRPEVLAQITSIPQGAFEQAESLEQLRWLQAGFKIAVQVTDHESIGIDTPADLERANKLL